MSQIITKGYLSARIMMKGYFGGIRRSLKDSFGPPKTVLVSKALIPIMSNAEGMSGADMVSLEGSLIPRIVGK